MIDPVDTMSASLKIGILQNAWSKLLLTKTTPVLADELRFEKVAPQFLPSISRLLLHTEIAELGTNYCLVSHKLQRLFYISKT